MRNFAPVDDHKPSPGMNPLDGLERTEMTAKKATEQQQQQQGSGSQTLNERYGKIGISAVAGAVQHKGEKRPATESRFTALESD
jgi:hypothetical protein